MSVRDLIRTFAIWPWEIEQAAELGWLCIVTQRPSGRGRPARVAELCDERNVKLPQPRRQIEKRIAVRPELFAMRCVFECCPRGTRFAWIVALPIVEAYLRTYPNVRSRAGASASASRLMKRRDVRSAMQWFYAQVSNEIPRGEPMPETVSAIRARLAELGSWRTKYV